MKQVKRYIEKLYCDEKAEATIQKYKYELMRFYKYISYSEITKEIVIEYKAEMKKNRAPSTINAAIAAINGFLRFVGKEECMVKPVRTQKCSYRDERCMLTKKEYRLMLQVARRQGDDTIYLVIETICALGLRVSELCYITKQAVEKGLAVIENKGKYRTILLPKSLCEKILRYCKRKKIQSGSVFIGRKGSALGRGAIWREMKKLGRQAGIACKKVFPHNLRHLFAACFYQKTKDIEHLSSILGHENMNTTRIYTMTSGEEHRRQLESLGLIC